MNDNNESILHIYCKDSRCKKSCPQNSTNEISAYIEIFYKHAKWLFTHKSRLEQQSPLHFAMRSGNIQKAKSILDVFTKFKNTNVLDQMFNDIDYNGMRPVDLLSIRQDSEHKKYGFLVTFIIC